MINLFNEVGEKKGKDKIRTNLIEKDDKEMSSKVESKSAVNSRRRVNDTQSSSQPSTKSPKNEAKKPDSKSFLMTRVAKNFDGNTYFGTIQAIKGVYWHVVYDDGDEEDFDKKDLVAALKLYEKTKKSDPEYRPGKLRRKKIERKHTGSTNDDNDSSDDDPFTNRTSANNKRARMK